jgi:DNA polymerase III gamma/tau subunit
MIVAKELGCDEVDFHHLNLSNTRGIAQARELSSNMQLRPMGGPIKVYLLNEVHGGTRDFFECMLDPLEFTPPHVMFILCTTDPQKLPTTIRSRCLRFDVKPLHAIEIRDLLNQVLTTEGIPDFPTEAVSKIGQICSGIPREALLLLNKIIDIPDDTKLLEALDHEVAQEGSLGELLTVLFERTSWEQVRTVLKKFQDEEPEKLRQSILTVCKNKLLEKDNRQAAVLIECFERPFYDSGFAGVVLACYRGVTIG